MESMLEIVLRVCIGSTFFYLFYVLLLRKTTFFKLNRFYLLAAVLLPLFFALFPVRYAVLIETPVLGETENWSELFRQTNAVTDRQLLPEENLWNWSSILLAIYATGLLLLALRLLLQSIRPIHLIVKNKKERQGLYPIVENKHFSVPFSFFNHIFIHPEYHKQEDLDVILTHEEVHIRERHWIDLLVIELFTLVFWFNPISWLLEQAIKQNHEYLADQGVLSRGQSPARYQLLLVNQLMGMQVLGLSNNLNFALGPTRLKMMKKQKTPRKQLLRLALLTPIVAGLLFAFAKPEYIHPNAITSVPTTGSELNAIADGKVITINGTIIDKKGDPLPGTSIVIKGTTRGTLADSDGKFKIDVPSDLKFTLVASFVGYETQELQYGQASWDSKSDIVFSMDRAIIGISTEYHEGDVPPPPPPPVPEELKPSGEEPLFIVVEDMPRYPGGSYGLAKYLYEQKNKLKIGFRPGDSSPKVDPTTVGFTVNETGKVMAVQILKSSGVDVLDNEAVRIVQGMEDWSPGKQRGKAVPVDYAVEIKF